MKTRGARGSAMLGLIALTMLLFVMSSLVTEQSLAMYLHSAQAHRRVQTRAAAEGAVVLLLQVREQMPRSLQIGEWTVEFGQKTAQGNAIAVPLTVLHNDLRQPYTARFTLDGTGRWTFAGLERPS